MSDPLREDVVADAKLAVQIGQILCEALYSDLAQQAPFFASDAGRCWRVEGSRNRDGAINGIAEFFLSIEKSDGRVADLGEYLRFPPHPSITPMLNEYFARIKTTEPRSISSGPFHPAAKADDEAATAERGSGMVLLTSMARGGVVFSSDVAIKIAEQYCQSHYGDLQRQAPLVAEDKDTCWRVEGNWNRDGKVNGPGPFFVLIAKYDARVTEIGE